MSEFIVVHQNEAIEDLIRYLLRLMFCEWWFAIQVNSWSPSSRYSMAINNCSKLSYHPKDLTKHSSINLATNGVNWSVMGRDLPMWEFGDGLQLTVIIYPCRMLTCHLCLLYSISRFPRSRLGFMVCMNDLVAGEEMRLEFRIPNQVWEWSHRYGSIIGGLMKAFHSKVSGSNHFTEERPFINLEVLLDS